MSDAEQELRVLAVKLAKEEWPIGSDEQHKLDADLFEHVLRESGLLELLQVGQEMWDADSLAELESAELAWDAARAKWHKGVGL